MGSPSRGDRRTTRASDKGACDRKARLAEALRENLRRRKAQARARRARASSDGASPGPGRAPDTGNESEG